MKTYPNILLNTIPAFIILILVEAFVLSREEYIQQRRKDIWASFALGVGLLVIGTITQGMMLFTFTFAYTHRIFAIPENAWWTWMVVFLADDFSFYWFHRTSHQVRFFWASHVVHHSSESYDYAAALRQTWTGNITGTFIFWTWMPLIGINPAMLMFMKSLSLVYQFLLHTKTVKRMPAWFEYVFNTPSHHRVHHASDVIYLDKNHGGVLIIWDRLLGTYQGEVKKPTFGLTKNIGSANPVAIAFYEWKNLACDLRKAVSFKHIINYVFNSPGWSHDGSTKTTKQLQSEINTKVLCPRLQNIYDNLVASHSSTAEKLLNKANQRGGISCKACE